LEKYSKISLKAPPEINGSEIDKLLAGRKFVPIKTVQEVIKPDTILNQDWVTISVLVTKSEVKKTKMNTNFIIFTLSDLEGTEVKFFLFGDAYDVWWKESCGLVIGILNAIPMASSDFAISYKIEKAAKIIKLGTCFDYGKCVGIDGINRCEGYINL
jgi:predicted peroxiredoxin